MAAIRTLPSWARRWATSCWASISASARRRRRRNSRARGPTCWPGIRSIRRRPGYSPKGTGRAGTMTTAGNLVFQGNAAAQLQRLPGRYRREGLVGRYAGGNHRRSGDLCDRWRAVRRRGRCRAVRIRRWRLLGAELRAPAGVQARWQRAAAGESGLHAAAAQSAGRISALPASWKRANTSTPRTAPAAMATTPPAVAR